MIISFRYYEDTLVYAPPTTNIVKNIVRKNQKVDCLYISKKLDHLKIIEGYTTNYILPCKNFFKSLNNLNIPGLFCYIRRIFFIHKKIHQNQYNFIYVRNEIFNGLLSLYFRRKYGYIFLFEIENPLEQDWYFRKIYYPNLQIFFYIISFIEKTLRMYLLKKADLVLPISEELGKYYIKKGIKRSKMYVLDEGVDLERFSNIESNIISNKYALNNYKVFIYLGALDNARGLNMIIKAFSEVRTISKSKLLIVGDGPDRLNLQKLSENLEISDDVIFTGFVDHDKIPNYIGSSDFGISLIQPLEIYKVSGPIKIIEYMAMRKPVIANKEIVEQNKIVKESKGGILINYNKDELVYAMMEMVNNPESTDEMGKNAYDWIVKNRSYDVLSSAFANRIYKMISN